MGSIVNNKMLIRSAVNIDFECEEGDKFWCFNIYNCIYLTGKVDNGKREDYWSSYYPMKIEKDIVLFFSSLDGDWIPAEATVQKAYKSHLVEKGLLG